MIAEKWRTRNPLYTHFISFRVRPIGTLISADLQLKRVQRTRNPLTLAFDNFSAPRNRSSIWALRSRGHATRSGPSDMGPDPTVLDPSANQQSEGPEGGTYGIAELHGPDMLLPVHFICFRVRPISTMPHALRLSHFRLYMPLPPPDSHITSEGDQTDLYLIGAHFL